VGEDWISVTSKGRLLIRNVCMVFDRYLQGGVSSRHSKTV
jgi:oxygen-independent coproporphyrinogen-3 oxidase